MSVHTYHTSHSYKTKDGQEVTFVTQLYQVGVYGIVNNDASMQGNFHPKDIQKFEKNIRLQEKKGEITDLKFSREITVSDETGLWEEID